MAQVSSSSVRSRVAFFECLANQTGSTVPSSRTVAEDFHLLSSPGRVLSAVELLTSPPPSVDQKIPVQSLESPAHQTNLGIVRGSVEKFGRSINSSCEKVVVHSEKRQKLSENSSTKSPRNALDEENISTTLVLANIADSPHERNCLRGDSCVAPEQPCQDPVLHGAFGEESEGAAENSDPIAGATSPRQEAHESLRTVGQHSGAGLHMTRSLVPTTRSGRKRKSEQIS